MKTRIADLLTASLELLKEAQAAPRTSKTLAAKIGDFIASTEEALTAPPPTEGTIFRLSCPTNPKTGRKVWVQVNKDGTLSPRTQKEVALPHVDAWTEIRASGWKEARELVEAGKGTPRTREEG